MNTPESLELWAQGYSRRLAEQWGQHPTVDAEYVRPCLTTLETARALIVRGRYDSRRALANR